MSGLVMSSGPPACWSARLDETFCPRKLTLTSSPPSVVPQSAVLMDCCSTMGSERIWGSLTSAIAFGAKRETTTAASKTGVLPVREQMSRILIFFSLDFPDLRNCQTRQMPSQTMPADILLCPARRSAKIIGNSAGLNLSREARSLSSIWKLYPSLLRLSRPIAFSTGRRQPLNPPVRSRMVKSRIRLE